MDLCNRNDIQALLLRHGFRFSKGMGQNFLIDTRVLDKIIAAAAITKDDCVLEVGPGIGTMTQYLAEHAKKVIAVEELNYNDIPKEKAYVRKYFTDLAKMFYSE